MASMSVLKQGFANQHASNKSRLKKIEKLNHNYIKCFKSCKLSQSAIDQFGIRFANVGYFANHFTFPCFDIQNSLKGIGGLIHKSSYDKFNIADILWSEGWKRGKDIYNLQTLYRTNLEPKCEVLTLVSSPLTVWKSYDFGNENVVAIPDYYMTEVQFSQLFNAINQKQLNIELCIDAPNLMVPDMFIAELARVSRVTVKHTLQV